MSHATGLAAAIRAATESETFDLGGQTGSTITNTIQAAFSEPLSLGQMDKSTTNSQNHSINSSSKMIRLTFVTGAGKLGRQRYDPDAAKAVTTTLRELGYQEDRAASCVVECAGSFKLQHDTGKNLKTVVVFPKITGTIDGTHNTKGKHGGSSGGGCDDGEEQQYGPPTLLLEESPEHMIATSSKAVFQRMLSTKCPSWSQKKGCAAALEKLRSTVADLDSKLVTGIPLDATEQEFYDIVLHLEDKEEHVRHEMHQQVEREDITSWEQQMLLKHNAERIAALHLDKNSKHNAQLDKALQRKKLLSNMIPKEPHNLRHEVTIRKLRKELLPFLRMEEEQKGRLRTVKETQTMARKDEIDLEIVSLEEDSRGWFEDEEAFQSRVAASRAAFAASQPKPKVKKVVTTLSAGGAVTKPWSANQKWVLPGDVKKGFTATTGSGNQAKKRDKAKSGTVFSSVTIDDDDDDDDVIMTMPVMKKPSSSRDTTINAGGESSETKTSTSNSGGNKKKKGKKQGQQLSEERALDEAFQQEQQARRKKEEEEGERKKVAHPSIAFARDYLLPVLAAILTWFVALVFGKTKKRKEKTR